MNDELNLPPKFCEICGVPIAPARLEAVPGVTTCIECAKKHPKKLDTSKIDLSQASPMAAGFDAQATAGLKALPLTPWQGPRRTLPVGGGSPAAGRAGTAPSRRLTPARPRPLDPHAT